MKNVKNWNDFIFEYKNINMLKYNIFDWDDNLLIMETPLHFQKFKDGKWINVDIYPNDFAQIRKKYPTNYMDNEEWKGDLNYTFVEFRDYGPRGNNAFIEDVKKTIKDGKFGPSWYEFIKTIVEGRLFAIVTTRGHEPETLKSAVRYIIDNVLTKEEKDEMIENINNFNEMFNIQTNDIISEYLNNCYFIGLFSKAFVEEFNYVPSGEKLNQGKKDAINKFVNYVRQFAKDKRIPLKVGFSDDDINFSGAAKELFLNMEKSLDFPENFYVFDTSNPKIRGGVKVKI